MNHDELEIKRLEENLRINAPTVPEVPRDLKNQIWGEIQSHGFSTASKKSSFIPLLIAASVSFFVLGTFMMTSEKPIATDAQLLSYLVETSTAFEADQDAALELAPLPWE